MRAQLSYVHYAHLIRPEPVPRVLTGRVGVQQPRTGPETSREKEETRRWKSYKIHTCTPRVHTRAIGDGVRERKREQGEPERHVGRETRRMTRRIRG